MRQKTVLLVDDEQSIRFSLSAILEHAGYAVDVAEDGFVALRKMQVSTPDVLITDLRMPNMNGFELLSVVRQRFPNLPAVAISGEFLASHIEEGPLADAFFQKGNYSIAEFLAKISELVNSPLQHRISARAPLWTPTGDAPVMLTCTNCLRSFPIDPCDSEPAPPKETDCIFCGKRLEVQLFAIGMAQSAAIR